MYLYELHMHTSHGSACGRATIGQMLCRYKELGFSGVVVTDHFLGGNTAVDRSLPWDEAVRAYAHAYTAGQQLARELDMDLLFGIEEGYGGGKEFLVYGVEPEFLLERPFLRSASVETWSREVHGAGGVLIYAHPFRDRAYIPNPLGMPDLSLADGVEIFNRGNDSAANARARVVFWQEDLILIAGSDKHSHHFDDPCALELSRRVHTSRELAQVLKSRDFSLRI